MKMSVKPGNGTSFEIDLEFIAVEILLPFDRQEYCDVFHTTGILPSNKFQSENGRVQGVCR